MTKDEKCPCCGAATKLVSKEKREVRTTQHYCPVCKCTFGNVVHEKQIMDTTAGEITEITQ